MEKAELVDYWTTYLEQKGYIIIEVTDTAIWYWDRNMNKKAWPLRMVDKGGD